MVDVKRPTLMLVSRSTSSAIAASARSHTIKKAEAKKEKVKEAATIQREVHPVSYVLFPIRRKSRRGTEGTRRRQLRTRRWNCRRRPRVCASSLPLHNTTETGFNNESGALLTQRTDTYTRRDTVERLKPQRQSVQALQGRWCGTELLEFSKNLLPTTKLR